MGAPGLDPARGPGLELLWPEDGTGRHISQIREAILRGAAGRANAGHVLLSDAALAEHHVLLEVLCVLLKLVRHHEPVLFLVLEDGVVCRGISVPFGAVEVVLHHLCGIHCGHLDDNLPISMPVSLLSADRKLLQLVCGLAHLQYLLHLFITHLLLCDRLLLCPHLSHPLSKAHLLPWCHRGCGDRPWLLLRGGSNGQRLACRGLAALAAHQGAASAACSARYGHVDPAGFVLA
mmetsp:Transcript_9929/g.28444  ORF Transcript_9929/g.28444 Transcript_9929/m.28444 type:complete len:234 (+) Transcript_9929:1099-1800(+)